MHVVRRFDLRQAVTGRQILDVHLEMDQDLEQRGGWTLSAVDHAPAAGVPMRDERLRAVHRGGPLDLHRHHLLAIWAADCADHVLPLFSGQYPRDDRPQRAIEAARAWARGETPVGKARAAGIQAHAAARDATQGWARAAARAAGQAVATAHMADHALHAALYAVRAVQLARKAEDVVVDRERTWQLKRLPEGIRPLIVHQLNRDAGLRVRD